MKKPENSKQFPFPLSTIHEIILHPEQYPLNDNTIIKRLSDTSWIEDFGDSYLLRYDVIQSENLKIVITNHQVAHSTNLTYQLTYEFQKDGEDLWTIKMDNKVVKGDVFRRFNMFVDNHVKASLFFIEILDKIYIHCKKAVKTQS